MNSNLCSPKDLYREASLMWRGLEEGICRVPLENSWPPTHFTWIFSNFKNYNYKPLWIYTDHIISYHVGSSFIYNSVVHGNIYIYIYPPVENPWKIGKLQWTRTIHYLSIVFNVLWNYLSQLPWSAAVGQTSRNFPGAIIVLWTLCLTNQSHLPLHQKDKVEFKMHVWPFFNSQSFTTSQVKREPRSPGNI
jgi:hypothetical protein